MKQDSGNKAMIEKKKSFNKTGRRKMFCWGIEIHGVETEQFSSKWDLQFESPPGQQIKSSGLIILLSPRGLKFRVWILCEMILKTKHSKALMLVLQMPSADSSAKWGAKLSMTNVISHRNDHQMAPHKNRFQSYLTECKINPRRVFVGVQDESSWRSVNAPPF